MQLYSGFKFENTYFSGIYLKYKTFPEFHYYFKLYRTTTTSAAISSS